MTVLSARNPRVAQLRRLIGRRRTRDDARAFVAEGPMLLAEALACGVVPEAVYVRADAELGPELSGDLGAAGVTYDLLDPAVFGTIASTTAPQPVLSVLPFVDRDIADVSLAAGAPPLVVVMAGVREPGNAGTIVRSAAAAGAAAVITCDDAVDLYNPKVVRATAGALFRVPIVRDVEIADLFDRLTTAGIRRVGLAGECDSTYDDIDLTGAVALVAGNEAHGLADEVRRHLDETIAIPLAAGIESLNVASALTVVAFEAARQRRRAR